METTTTHEQDIATFGYDASVIAYVLGMPVPQAALVISSVLTGLTGPWSGLSNLGGRGIAHGTNLLAVTTADHRTKRLADHLLEPAFAIQSWIRQAATRSSKGLTDLVTFGAGDYKAWTAFLTGKRTGLHDKLIPQFNAVLKDIEAGDSLTTGWDNPDALQFAAIDRSPELHMVPRIPGLRHHPSFLLSLANLENLPGMLDEVVDRHGLIVDLEGRFFCPGMSPKAATALRRFSEELGGGDVPLPRLHPDQGHGSLCRSGINLIASISEDRLVEVLRNAGTPEHNLLSQAILFKPSWKPCPLLNEGAIRPVLRRYKSILEGLVNFRAARLGTVFPLRQEEVRGLEKLDHEFTAALDGTPVPLRPYLKPFSGFVDRLFWAFTLLKREQANDWRLAATRATALSALNGHVGVLENALSSASAKNLAQCATRILRVLEQKGPSTIRNIQRSINNSKAADIASALDSMVTANRVVYRSASRTYDLPGDEAFEGSAMPAHRPQPLTVSADA